jgi:hypothetical protein
VSRWLALVIAVALWPAVSLASAAPLDIPSITISGGNLPHAVHLAPADADAFRRRINRPPRLKNAPDPSGASYTLTSTYWQDSFTPDKDKGESDDSQVGADATYYPDGGFVLTHVDGKDAWLVIDLRQRAILDRYIRLTLANSINEQPGELQVLSSAARDETFGVQLGSRVLTPAEIATFWSLVAGLAPKDTPKNPDFVPPPAGPHTVWITITLPDGRSVQLVHDAVSGTLVEPVAQEVYAVSQAWLTPILGTYDPTTLGATLGSSIEQQKPAGSQLWWPVMVGGGLLAIGLAVWWQRRQGGRL